MIDPLVSTGGPGQVPLATVVNRPAVPRESDVNADFAATQKNTQATLTDSPGLRQTSKETAKEHASQALAAPMSLEESAKVLREYIEKLPSDLKFRKDEASGYVVYQVTNPITGKVIRQYPPEEVLKMAQRLKDLLNGEEAGVLLDQQS